MLQNCVTLKIIRSLQLSELSFINSKGGFVLTTALRLLLAKQLKPFVFKQQQDFLPDFNVSNLGVYIHIPFCLKLCDFCPYYKIKYDQELMDKYVDSVIREIQLVAERSFYSKKELTSLYFGGGTPGLLGSKIIDINNEIDKHFEILGHRGIELNPSDVKDDNIDILQRAGIDIVSLGIQSFSSRHLNILGREKLNLVSSLNLLGKSSFRAVDVDLIFGIPGQSCEDLITDFKIAADNGATQISTYPYIDFSYANNKNKPLGLRYKKKMLEELIKTSEEKGFIRTSVWTFTKKNVPIYSSVTRDNFIGFGASATSLGQSDFKVNVFSVKEYINTIKKGQIPTNINLHFNQRSRGLYWLFWRTYNGKISGNDYYNLFKRSITKDFGISLKIGVILGLLKRTHNNWNLTEKGSYYFHIIEQLYTHQYIDKTWRLSMTNPWVKELKLY